LPGKSGLGGEARLAGTIVDIRHAGKTVQIFNHQLLVKMRSGDRKRNYPADIASFTRPHCPIRFPLRIRDTLSTT
jgi:hypothetical protein